METSPLRLRQPQETDEAIECWDDDEDLQCNDDIQFRTVSAGTSVTGSSSFRPSGHRDSISSRRSCRSDLDSNGGDEDWQLLLHDNDEAATKDAIASAQRAGIPLPTDVPSSALLGGTIKRLGGRKLKKAIGDDWSEDLELSGVEGDLELKFNRKETFPDSLLQLGSFSDLSPVKARDFDSDPFIINNDSLSPPRKPNFANLDRFRDTEDDSSFHDVPTIKIAKSRPQQTILPAPSTKLIEDGESFEVDLEFPADGEPLKLSTRKDRIKSPEPSLDDLDTEWAEGSIGVRFGGTKRDGFSNRSSTVSALSPSVSSCLTAESQDDGLDGLLLPDGPLDLEQAIKRRQQSHLSQSPQTSAPHQSPRRASPTNDDFFSGIEIGDGEVFDSGKLTLNRNIKRKNSRPISPARRTATSITFTNKTPVPPTTRIPRLSGHERPRSTHLEPVSESGVPLPKYRRPRSRLSGHSAHSSLSSIPLPSPPSMSPPQKTPGRRSPGNKTSGETLRLSPTITNAQLMKAKRSVPALRNVHQSGVTPIPWPPSRQDSTTRTHSSRPKTPTAESRLASGRRPSIPFLPAGAAHNKSHHVNVKTPRHYRRTDSDSSTDLFSNPRSTSGLSNRDPPNTPGRFRFDLGPESLAATVKQTITRPNRRRNFGDGSELDIFDDLPTSASLESKFVKHPIRHGAPRSMRSRLSQSHIVPPPMAHNPIPRPHTSPTKQDFTPRFAQDTNASRNAREQRIASMNFTQNREITPLVPLSTNWKSSTSVRALSHSSIKNHREKGSGDHKPHLIKPMGTGVHEAKSVKGMRYNPATYKWEGNENATVEFEPIPSPRSPRTTPALITNVGATSGVQVVGGMVFDPQRMCWLKVAATQSGKEVITLAPDEEDVLEGLDDLKEMQQKSNNASRTAQISNDMAALDNIANLEDKSAGESSDEWPITEEFDVGPEFIKRQRAEEEKWRRKVSKWITPDRTTLGDGWRWVIRDMVRSDLTGTHSMGRH
ncbi:cytokinesis regulator [Histoplasma capsulatum var. duboisii H88]|uniref:Cytokinesis regulator n=1 Tax=Ajellomyces capsulatus (strain H88) TaxID=544711 RepID=F0UQT5_AJEC8|nr:cytokinesis regulator [Histoplasma capsulatum var. duboisii H88]QSS50289.1 cytokinesis regulator [Histoplasma capsulatum var. duboisii H88]